MVVYSIFFVIFLRPSKVTAQTLPAPGASAYGAGYMNPALPPPGVGSGSFGWPAPSKADVKKAKMMMMDLEGQEQERQVSVLYLASCGNESDSIFNQSGQKSSNIHTLGDNFQKMVSKLPAGDLKNGLQQYLKVISTEKYTSDNGVRANNSGIDSYNISEFSSHGCFAKLALNFYEEIKRELGGAASADGKCLNCKTLRLDEKAGDGRFKNLDPGWVWNLAVKKSQGNPDLAMALIGLCGHDDKAQGSFNWFDKSEEGIKKHRDFQNDLEKHIKELNQMLLKERPSTFKYSNLTDEIENKKNILNAVQKCKGYPHSVSCPSNTSGFYASQSLGEQADIPDSLKRKIATIQAPSRGESVLPSKYYHIYGGAFMACQLIEQGVSPTMAKTAEVEAGYIYRSVTLCSEINSLLKDRTDLSKEYPGSQDIARLADTLSNKCDHTPIPQEPDKDLLRFDIMTNDIDFNVPMCKQKIKNGLNRMNAAFLYQRWYLGGSTIIGNLPCTDIRIDGPLKINPDQEGSLMKFIDQKSCGSSFASATCDDARRVLSTWDVDFEWTKSQHKVGAEFAAKNCRKLKPGEDPYQDACGIVEDGKNTSTYDSTTVK